MKDVTVVHGEEEPALGESAVSKAFSLAASVFTMWCTIMQVWDAALQASADSVVLMPGEGASPVNAIPRIDSARTLIILDGWVCLLDVVLQ